MDCVGCSWVVMYCYCAFLELEVRSVAGRSLVSRERSILCKRNLALTLRWLLLDYDRKKEIHKLRFQSVWDMAMLYKPVSYALLELRRRSSWEDSCPKRAITVYLTKK